MIHTSVPDQIDAPFAIILGLVLWVLLIVVILVQRQRAKIRKQKYDRAAAILARREAFIRAANEQDERDNEAREQQGPQKRDRR